MPARKGLIMVLFKRYQPLISESLGNNRAVELDPGTGSVTILDEQHGVSLSACQVLVLTGFLSQHDATLIRAALAMIERTNS